MEIFGSNFRVVFLLSCFSPDIKLEEKERKKKSKKKMESQKTLLRPLPASTQVKQEVMNRILERGNGVPNSNPPPELIDLPQNVKKLPHLQPGQKYKAVCCDTLQCRMRVEGREDRPCHYCNRPESCFYFHDDFYVFEFINYFAGTGPLPSMPCQYRQRCVNEYHRQVAFALEAERRKQEAKKEPQ